MSIKSTVTSITAGIVALAIVAPGLAWAEGDRSGRDRPGYSRSHDGGQQERGHRERNHRNRSGHDTHRYTRDRHVQRDYKFAKNARKYYQQGRNEHRDHGRRLRGHHDRHSRAYVQPHASYYARNDDDGDENLIIGLLLGGLFGYAISNSADAGPAYNYYDD